MRIFTTIILALSFGGLLTGCAKARESEPTVENSRAKAKTPCGGFAGLACPDNQTCVDDPSDSCDPNQGGADCMGMCVHPHGHGNDHGKDHSCDYTDPTRSYVGESLEECAVVKFVCAEGRHYFADDCGCGCELD